MSKLEEIKRIADNRHSIRGGINDAVYYSEFSAMCWNNIDKLLAVVEAAKVFYEIKEKKRIAVINGSPNKPSMFEIANSEMSIFKALDELERE